MSYGGSPLYATNSDTSAGSSPLLPFGNKQLRKDEAEEDDGWGAAGSPLDEGSPEYGSAGVQHQEDVNKRGAENGNGQHSQTGYSHGRPHDEAEAGPSRKRPRLADDTGDSRSHSYATTPQPPSRGEPGQAFEQAPIPFPHQIPLPDMSKTMYLSGLDDPEIQRRGPYIPVPRIIMHSILGFTPRNEVSREIGEWIMMTCPRLPGNVEIEIKFGHITQKGRSERLVLPVKTETLINEDMIEVGFKSDMPPWAHASINQILNKSVQMTNSPKGHPDYPPHSYYPLKHKHTYTDDTFYSPLTLPGQDPIPDPNFVKYYGRGRRRLTKKTGTNEVVECMQKVKVGHVHVYCPMEAFDFRVSVNCEFPCQAPSLEEPYSGMRRKDRVTYSHSLFQIDLTAVTTFDPKATNASKSFELELEILEPQRLIKYGNFAREGRDVENRYEEMMDCILNSVRLLNKNAIKPPPPSAGAPPGHK